MKPRCKKMINGHFRLAKTLSLGSEEVPAGAWLIYPDEDCCPECGEEIFRNEQRREEEMKCDDCGEAYDPEKGNSMLNVCLDCEEGYTPCIGCGWPQKLGKERVQEVGETLCAECREDEERGYWDEER